MRLLLHGGPGDTQSQFTKTYEPLERDFVVVQWDQRGAGRTRAHAVQAADVSVDLLVRDGIELAQYLENYLHSRNVVLVGHSWGSFLGVQIVMRRPDLFRAFVGTGQVVSAAEMIDYQYRYTLERAGQTNNVAAVTELQALGTPASGDLNQYLKLRRWLNLFLAPSDARWMAAQDGMLQRALGPDDLKAYWEGFQTMTGLTSTVFSMDVRPLGYRFKLPFFVIQGADDHITPMSAAANYVQQIQTPVKQLIPIAGAGHFAMMTHSGEFRVAMQGVLHRLSH